MRISVLFILSNVDSAQENKVSLDVTLLLIPPPRGRAPSAYVHVVGVIPYVH